MTAVTAVESRRAYIDLMNHPVAVEQHTNELYERLAPEVRKELEKYEEIRTIDAGVQLINQGVLLEHLIIINSGSVEISVPSMGKNIALTVAGSGKVFGLRTAVSGETPEVDVTTLDECTVSLVPRKRFSEVLEKHPQIYFVIAQLLSKDLKMADDLLRRIPRSAVGGCRRINCHKRI